MDQSLAVETPVSKQIQNTFILYGFPSEIIEYIMELKRDLEDQETMYFQRNCIVHECLHFNISDKTIREYRCEKKLYNDYYRLAIPMNQSIHWCIRTGVSRLGTSVRNRYLTQIEMLLIPDFIMTSFRGRIFPSSLKERVKLFSSKPYIFIMDAYDEYISYGNPIIIDVSGELLYY